MQICLFASCEGGGVGVGVGGAPTVNVGGTYSEVGMTMGSSCGRDNCMKAFGRDSNADVGMYSAPES